MYHSERSVIAASGFWICAPDEQGHGGVMLQMTFIFSAHQLRVRASKIINATAAHFHSHGFGGFCPAPPFHNHRDSETWFVKVVCTLCCTRNHRLDHCVDYLGKSLTQSLAFQVIRCLSSRPQVGLEFLQFSRVKLNLRHSLATYSLLLRSLCLLGLHDSALSVFGCMRSDGHLPNNSIVGFLVCSFAQVGNISAAEGLLTELQRQGIRIGSIVYNNLLNLLVRQKRVEQALVFFKEKMKAHSCADTCSFNIVIRGLCRRGEVSRALEFFNEMESFGCSPDVITYNTVINGLCKINEVDKACGLLERICTEGELSPDIITYTSIISGFFKLGKSREASILFDEMISSGVKPNTVNFNVLIDGFGKSGNMAAALSMFKKMLFLGCFPDIVTFSSLIDGYCRTGQVDEGLKLLHEMSARNLSPNEYTFAILINSLCKRNRLDEARDLLRHPNWRDIVPQPFMYNPLIDGYCKAGNVDEANVVLEEMEKSCKPDKLTFTILIIGHCMKGRMFNAISLFHKMLSIGCTPDYITVSSLVSCLLKAAMPNEAKHIIHIASKDMNTEEPSKRTFPVRTNTVIPVAV